MAIALVSACQPLTGALDCQAALFGGDYVWWYMEKLPWRDRDGGMRVLYSLNLPPGATVTAEPRVYYQSQERRRYDEERRQKPPPPRFYRKQLEKRDGRYFMEVYSGESRRFEVRAEVELDGRPYYAQTSFSLGGSSDRADFGVEELESWPEGPEMSLKDPRLLRVRLEEEVSLRLDHLAGAAPNIVSVFDQTGGIQGRLPVTGGLFAYTPPYDQKLASGGYRGRNHAIFVARLGEGVLTYYAPVHRNSQHSHSSVGAGLLVAAVTAGICLVFVATARLRFKFRGGRRPLRPREISRLYK